MNEISIRSCGKITLKAGHGSKNSCPALKFNNKYFDKSLSFPIAASESIPYFRLISAKLFLSEPSAILKYLESLEYDKMKSYHLEMEVETRLDKDLMNILGSPVHISKTIMNLVSNGAEAMLEGGHLLISTENRYVDKPIGRYEEIEKGDYVVLTVSDTGSGISSDDMGKIFEPFYTKKTMGRSGTGLGMAVVRGTVKDHKGYIGVQSTEGKGTTFTLYFPVTREKRSEKSAKIPLEKYLGSGDSILVVDDVQEQRDIASSILSELGYSVTTVSCGEEAIEYLKNASPTCWSWI